MNDLVILTQPLTRAAFAPFGDVIAADEAAQHFPINNGTTERFHALARADVVDGDVILSIFRGQPLVAPVPVALMERHPLGSQAFMPLSGRDWLVVVAPDEDGRPGTPLAFLATGEQGVQYGRNVWHRPLAALGAESDFLVVDREGDGNNLEEYTYPQPYRVDLP